LTKVVEHLPGKQVLHSAPILLKKKKDTMQEADSNERAPSTSACFLGSHHMRGFSQISQIRISEDSAV
jgi:hypothetical protein